jgi:hypothetical protein
MELNKRKNNDYCFITLSFKAYRESEKDSMRETIKTLGKATKVHFTVQITKSLGVEHRDDEQWHQASPEKPTRKYECNNTDAVTRGLTTNKPIRCHKRMIQLLLTSPE